MVTLLQRIVRQFENTSGENITGHSFPSVLIMYLTGLYTQGKAYTSLNIGGGSADRLAQQADFELFKTKYDSLNVNQQQTWLLQVIASTEQLLRGNESKVQFATDLDVAIDTG